EAVGGTSRTVTYSYDPVGNRTGVTVNGAPTETRSYDAADQVVGWQYDAGGQLLSDGAQGYTYDPLGRLSSATKAGSTTTYGYNGDGVLATQTAGGATTRYTL